LVRIRIVEDRFNSKPKIVNRKVIAGRKYKSDIFPGLTEIRSIRIDSIRFIAISASGTAAGK
jgi:hypothetical protein